MSAVTPPLPGVKHKVIGLVSGGKDSTFNLLHCVANGHELVAIATLTPEPGTGGLYTLGLVCR
jgi:diphthine-ammonia ligase